MHTKLLSLKLLYSLVFSGITVLNNIMLLITQSHLSVAQASPCFKHLDTHTPTCATPTSIPKAPHLGTYVQLF